MTPDGLILAGRSVYFDAIDYDTLGVRWQARVTIDTSNNAGTHQRVIVTGYSDPTMDGALMRLVRLCVADRRALPWDWDTADRGDHYAYPPILPKGGWVEGGAMANEDNQYE